MIPPFLGLQIRQLTLTPNGSRRKGVNGATCGSPPTRSGESHHCTVPLVPCEPSDLNALCRNVEEESDEEGYQTYHGRQVGLVVAQKES